MGGLKKYMPSTRWTYLFATIAIAGIPLTAGFFSNLERSAKGIRFLSSSIPACVTFSDLCRYIESKVQVS